MPNSKKREASFQTQGRLLQELGERLVAKPDVALMELIKNAYDADASECHVVFNGTSVEIKDDGHGMTESEFINKWMNIATSDKQRERESRQYKRTVTGSKGIGRFAVRFLGRNLRLETIAIDKTSKSKTLLSIDFDWKQLDSAIHLHEVKIPYEVKTISSKDETGTRLIITELRNPRDIDFDKEMRTELLSIVDPFLGLETGGYGRIGKSKQDPGFKVILPKTDKKEEENLVGTVLKNAFARLTIKLNGSKVEYIIDHKDGRNLLRKTITRPTHIKNGFYADIRYCPKRAGMFRDTEVDGRRLWKWLREHGGIGIVDHGFRIRPYGFPDNDWLDLGLDTGHNKRDWRIDFMNELYPMSPEASSQPKQNPMLYLPNFHQLIGAVFVESSQDNESERPMDLTSSMDREGFVHNEGFRELFELTRAGLEMLAYIDHKEQRRLEKKAAQEAAKEMRKDFREAVKFVKSIPSLSEGDKEKVVNHFETLTKELKDVQDYNRITTSKMETVGLLGVLAGFLTHEMKRLVHDLDRILSDIQSQTGKSVKQDLIDRIIKTRDEINGQIQFASTFISNVQTPYIKDVPLNVKSQVDRVYGRFKYFTDQKGVKVDFEDIADDLTTPPLPVALYSGVVLNLFTNALKAVFGGQGSLPKPKVIFKAWNEPKRHILEVADTGVGIPYHLRERIWDPLFTTTSGGSSNPLGSGMGLGLSLVKKLLLEIGGRIELVDPPPGFNTCFHVQFTR